MPPDRIEEDASASRDRERGLEAQHAAAEAEAAAGAAYKLASEALRHARTAKQTNQGLRRLWARLRGERAEQVC